MPTRPHIPEPDWKLFRQLRLLALDRFCQRVLAEIHQISTDPEKTHHERYLDVYELIHERDEGLARSFNDPKRSTALIQLASIQVLGLLTDEEFHAFSPEVRASVENLLDL